MAKLKPKSTLWEARYQGEKQKFYFKSKPKKTTRAGYKLVSVKKVKKPTWIKKAKAW